MASSAVEVPFVTVRPSAVRAPATTWSGSSSFIGVTSFELGVDYVDREGELAAGPLSTSPSGLRFHQVGCRHPFQPSRRTDEELWRDEAQVRRDDGHCR